MAALAFGAYQSGQSSYSVGFNNVTPTLSQSVASVVPTEQTTREASKTVNVTIAEGAVSLQPKTLSATNAELEAIGKKLTGVIARNLSESESYVGG